MNTELAQIHLNDGTRDIRVLIAETQAVLGEAVCEFPSDSLALSFGGAEDVALISIAHRHDLH